MIIKEKSVKETSENNSEDVYSLRVKTKNGTVVLTNLKLSGNVPEEGRWYNEDEFDYGDKLE